MAKFPTEVEESVVVGVPLPRTYAFLWDVAGSARCIEGLESCTPVGDATYRFVHGERSSGPVSLVVRYTSRYHGNGTDEIRYRSIAAAGDNTDVDGFIRLAADGPGGTRIVLRQMLAPETPVPRLLQGLIRGFVEREASEGVRRYLAAVKRALEAGSATPR
jgi:hypothetical protein